MEELNTPIFAQAKVEYTNQLIEILYPHIFDGIQSIYDESKIIYSTKTGTPILLLFRELLEKVPIWMFHGEKDDVIPIESSLFIYEYLKEKNKNIYLTTYPNVMHDSWTMTYENQEVYDWLLSFKF